jgi:hypothetical protein
MKKLTTVLFAIIASLTLPLAAQTYRLNDGRTIDISKMTGGGIPHAALRVAFAQTTTGNTATVTWTPSTTPGGTVTIYRCVGTPCTATSSFTLLATGIAAAGPYVDNTITAGVYSYYGVTVLNGATSAPSNIASGTLSPQPPTGLAVAVQ